MYVEFLQGVSRSLAAGVFSHFAWEASTTQYYGTSKRDATILSQPYRTGSSLIVCTEATSESNPQWMLEADDEPTGYYGANSLIQSRMYVYSTMG
jgi:hypothetical protein